MNDLSNTLLGSYDIKCIRLTLKHMVPEVVKLFSCSAELSMKFQQLI